MKADVPLANRPAPEPGDVRPFFYPSVPARDLASINRFHGSDWRIALRLDEREIALAPAARGLSAGDADYLPFALAVGSEHVELRLPSRLVAALLGSFGSDGATTVLDPTRKALLIEAAFAEVVAELETRLGETVELREQAGQFGASELQFAIAVRLEADPVEIAGIAGPSGVLDRLFAFLPAARALPGWGDPIPVPLSLRQADVQITLGELKRARPGDVLLFDRHLPAGEACLLVGRHLAAPVRIDSDTARLQAAPAPVRSSRWEWLMDDLDEDSSAEEGAAALDDLPVRVIFEFGRSEMTLKELAGLGAGSIVALPTSSNEPLSLIANGRRIGQGEPVRIGEALGVRITRLFDA
ncbi:type III secretion system cytoplasmic ring protein SctQ [Bosea sp. NPDC055332]